MKEENNGAREPKTQTGGLTMKETRMDVVKTSMKVGAVIGGIVFLLFGILPGFHFGSAGIIMLLSKVAGGAVEATLFVRILLVLGAVLGISCLGMLSIVLGSVMGTVSGAIVSAFTGVKTQETSEEMI
jgi:hypothetical protein